MSSPTGYDFYPNSDNVVINGSFAGSLVNGGLPFNGTASTTVSLNGFFNSTSFNNDIIPFAPAVYTVVGGDEWGQLILLHFVVI